MNPLQFEKKIEYVWNLDGALLQRFKMRIDKYFYSPEFGNSYWQLVSTSCYKSYNSLDLETHSLGLQDNVQWIGVDIEYTGYLDNTISYLASPSRSENGSLGTVYTFDYEI